LDELDFETRALADWQRKNRTAGLYPRLAKETTYFNVSEMSKLGYDIDFVLDNRDWGDVTP
jgi:hypothetical protein